MARGSLEAWGWRRGFGTQDAGCRGCGPEWAQTIHREPVWAACPGLPAPEQRQGSGQGWKTLNFSHDFKEYVRCYFLFRLFSVSRYYEMLSVACCAYSSLCCQENFLWAILTTHAVWKSQAKNLNMETRCTWMSGGPGRTDTFKPPRKKRAVWGLRRFPSAVPPETLAGNATALAGARAARGPGLRAPAEPGAGCVSIGHVSTVTRRILPEPHGGV